MQKIIVVVGPTASGKTALSIALAKHFGGEIVSADSMQIYREMQIGTAKPDEQEKAGIPHHLMGHIGVDETYSVAEYTEQATAVLKNLEKRNILPIICGGTGLYIQHLLESTEFFDIPIDGKIRANYQKIQEESGSDYLYNLLLERDSILAEHLHPNDTKRIIRGLEVYESTGKRLSDFQRESKRLSHYEPLYIGLNYKERELLYQRINLRVDQMMERGLLQEVRNLLEKYQLSNTARAAIGYKELIDAFEGKCSIDDAVELIKQKSRNYAKRQLSWFRRNKNIHWFYPDELDFDCLINNAISLTEKFLEDTI